MSSHAAARRGLHKAKQYALLMRLHRPIGALLLLWPILWGLWIAARGVPNLGVLCIFVAGVFVMRSAGCVINDYADREFDPHVARTKDRPLAAGRVSERETLTLFGVLMVCAFGLVLMTNAMTVALSTLGALLAATYPFMKRYTHFPQIYLGIAFGWGVPMGFAAELEAVPPVAWAVFATAIVWAVVYDTMYAMVDRDDDLEIGVKSTAVLLGNADRAFVLFSQIVCLALLYLVGQMAGLGALYHAALAVAAGFSAYQQHLIRDREPGACFKAFMNNNWFGAVVFAGIALDYL